MIMKRIIITKPNLYIDTNIHMPLSVDALQVKMETIEKDLIEVKSNVKEILDKFDNLDERYTTRREFKAVVSVLGFLATALWIVATILWFTH